MLDILKLRGNCSKCGENIVTIENYCPHCGNIIPLPKDIDLLSRKDKQDTKVGCHHVSHKELGGKFCPRCGEKL